MLPALYRVLVRLRPCYAKTDISVTATSPTSLIFSNLAEGPDASYEFDGVLGQVDPSPDSFICIHSLAVVSVFLIDSIASKNIEVLDEQMKKPSMPFRMPARRLFFLPSPT